MQAEKKKRRGEHCHENPRRAGVLLHISSLPGPYGIGDLGRGAYDFLEFLKGAGQRCWQFLPLGPVTGAFGYSPYMSSSSFAGNFMLLSPETLYKKGLVDMEDIKDLPEFSEYLVKFPLVEEWKKRLLIKAFERFISGSRKKRNLELLEEFSASEEWLDNYVLFAGLKERFSLKPWNRWPEEISSFNRSAVASARKSLSESLNFHAFVQFMFHEQWTALRERASEMGIMLFGDMPFYVAYDSADVWASQECFDLDPVTHLPRTVAGVPPDYFSATGQRWGNPIYRWKNGNRINNKLYDWWRSRFRRHADMLDMLRIDHFRGFAAYWSIDAHEKTAVKGRWIKGPGKGFFDRVFKGSRDLEIVAEDLGTITPDVERLRCRLGFPGMKVLQFAFDSDNANPYLPHNFSDTNCVVYTGTHDNDTIVGWYLDPASGSENKARARRYANSSGNAINRDFIRMAYSSVAALAVVPLQDILGFGSDCRMNTPSSADNNWRWRCAARFLNPELSDYIREEAIFYARYNPDKDL